MGSAEREILVFFGVSLLSFAKKAGTGGSGMGGVLRYKWELYYSISLSSRLRSQQGTALQMGGVLRYKLEMYCQYFSDRLYGLGVPEQRPSMQTMAR